MEDIKKGKLLAIATKKARRAPMILMEATKVTIEQGVEGDHRGKPGARQVTVISKVSWDAACQDLHVTLPWIARRANLLVSGLMFSNTKGRFLQIGELILKITGETKPCSRMDEYFQGLQEVLKPEWRGGVTCKVVKSGRVRVNDVVTLAEYID